jgi:hypothetical protein
MNRGRKEIDVSTIGLTLNVFDIQVVFPWPALGTGANPANILTCINFSGQSTYRRCSKVRFINWNSDLIGVYLFCHPLPCC